MTRFNSKDTEIERVADRMVVAAVEALATNLAAYLAGAHHQPAENGRQAVIYFLEGMADAPLASEDTEGGDSDEAQSRALQQIGEIVMRIRSAARL